MCIAEGAVSGALQGGDGTGAGWDGIERRRRLRCSSGRSMGLASLQLPQQYSHTESRPHIEVLLSAGGALERVVKMESVTGVALGPEPKGEKVKTQLYIPGKKNMTSGNSIQRLAGEDGVLATRGKLGFVEISRRRFGPPNKERLLLRGRSVSAAIHCGEPMTLRVARSQRRQRTRPGHRFLTCM